MLRLDTFEILENAQKVCTTWRRASKNSSLWRKIDMRNHDAVIDRVHLNKMCRNAVDRSEGGLVEISIGNFGTDSLLTYIADRSSNLRSLAFGMVWISNYGIVNAVAKLPLLEVLEFSETCERLDLKSIGQFCPKLKTLKINSSGSFLINSDNGDALAIADSMPELRHLQLIENRLTNFGLNAILDNCPHLEHLDLRMCLNIYLFEDLEKRCFEKLKEFKRPKDSISDCPYDVASFHPTSYRWLSRHVNDYCSWNDSF